MPARRIWSALLSLLPALPFCSKDEKNPVTPGGPGGAGPTSVRFFVDAARGSDSNPGDSKHPLLSIQSAIDSASGRGRAGGASPGNPGAAGLSASTHEY